MWTSLSQRKLTGALTISVIVIFLVVASIVIQDRTVDKSAPSEYVNDELGISFQYPQAWGEVEVVDQVTKTELQFSSKSSVYFQMNKKDALGRGGTLADPFVLLAGVATDENPATEVIDKGGGKQISIWLDYDLCRGASSSREYESCKDYFRGNQFVTAAASAPLNVEGFERGLGIVLGVGSTQDVQDFQKMVSSIVLAK